MKQIPLYGKGNIIRAYAIVDDGDYEWAMGIRWNMSKNGYAAHRKPCLYLHQGIANRMGLNREGMDVDHANGDKLDARRINIRLATRSQNSFNRNAPGRRNTSGYRGVCWHRAHGLWFARISKDRKIAWAKWFKDKDKAIAEHRAKSRELYGDFAPCS